MKRRIYSVMLLLLWLTAFPFAAGAEGRIFQGHIVDGALTDENNSKIYQGHIVDGVTADDGDSAPGAQVPDDAPTFTVKFFPNGSGASVPWNSKQVTNGRAYGELPVPERANYVFQGWYTDTGAKITPNKVVNLSADLNLYAQWAVLTYEVRLDANGGTLREISIDIPKGGDYGELPRPARTGYTFEGWYTLPRGGERVSNYAPLYRQENHTLYAHWAAVPAPDDTEDYAGTGFQDVSTNSSYYPAVCWAVRRGITSGTSPETFSPNDPCKRRHILTFLWRANGCPETQLALSAISPGTLWAYENTLIPAEVLYNDEDASTRSDAVTYLWKLAGCPTEEASLQSVLNRFTDVAPESEYAAAVAWALDAGITNGTTDTTFSPERICTRGQIVTFLYRCYTR
ncbi:MAG: InlB B-repeat-containing protein [Oscillibacter sp.]|nr:InlB B-repeat-containing protein [Oscillibacter sp.]